MKRIINFCGKWFIITFLFLLLGLAILAMLMVPPVLQNWGTWLMAFLAHFDINHWTWNKNIPILVTLVVVIFLFKICLWSYFPSRKD